MALRQGSTPGRVDMKAFQNAHMLSLSAEVLGVSPSRAFAFAELRVLMKSSRAWGGQASKAVAVEICG